jgi:hypothetical protein
MCRGGRCAGLHGPWRSDADVQSGGLDAFNDRIRAGELS